MANLFVEGLGGTVTWEGELTMNTQITLPSSKTISLGGLIAQTNGDALEWFENELGEKHPALKYVAGEFIPAVNTEQHDTIDGNARKVD
jgi:hypothetical protein